VKQGELIKEYNKQLRKPDLFLETDEGFGVGYWHVPQGIWKAERYKNGYHPGRGVLIDNNELVHLVKLIETEIRDLDDKSGCHFLLDFANSSWYKGIMAADNTTEGNHE
jgi:hypothetical protein